MSIAQSDELVAELEASLYGKIAELRAQIAERDALIAQVTQILGGYPDSYAGGIITEYGDCACVGCRRANRWRDAGKHSSE